MSGRIYGVRAGGKFSTTPLWIIDVPEPYEIGNQRLSEAISVTLVLGAFLRSSGTRRTDPDSLTMPGRAW